MKSALLALVSQPKSKEVWAQGSRPPEAGPVRPTLSAAVSEALGGSHTFLGCELGRLVGRSGVGQVFPKTTQTQSMVRAWSSLLGTRPLTTHFQAMKVGAPWY